MVTFVILQSRAPKCVKEWYANRVIPTQSGLPKVAELLYDHKIKYTLESLHDAMISPCPCREILQRMPQPLNHVKHFIRRSGNEHIWYLFQVLWGVYSGYGAHSFASLLQLCRHIYACAHT